MGPQAPAPHHATSPTVKPRPNPNANPDPNPHPNPNPNLNPDPNPDPDPDPNPNPNPNPNPDPNPNQELINGRIAMAAITAATGLSISQGTFLNEVLDGRLPQSWF